MVTSLRKRKVEDISAYIVSKQHLSVSLETVTILVCLRDCRRSRH